MSSLPYRDPNLSIDERVDDLIGRMTLAEKAGQMFHPSTFLPDETVSADTRVREARSAVVEASISHFMVHNGKEPAEIAEWTNRLQALAATTRLGIPVTFSSDPRNGFHNSPFTGKTLDSLSRWPEHVGIAATADTEVARGYGDSVRRELRAMGISVYLGPMADVFTEPRWSRGYGTFGEDVELVGRLTAAMIEGLRGAESLGADSVAAVVKHFPGGGPQKDGLDAHDSRFREQVYPGGMQELHLKPFAAAFTAGVTQVMPYYGMPIGTDWEEKGFAFNAPVIDGILRQRFGFDGIVLTDWYLIESVDFGGGLIFGPNGHGLENVEPNDRVRFALDAGVDQFGGDKCPERIVELVRSGAVSEARIDVSVRRILREKFRLGLFEQVAVEPNGARAVGVDPVIRARSVDAQRRSLTLLKNDEVAGAPLLPLPRETRVYAEGLDWSGLGDDGVVRVDDVAEADVALVRLSAPFSNDADAPFGDFFHHGSLEFDAAVIDHVTAIAQNTPTIIVVHLDRPAVLTPLVAVSSAIIGEYGADARVLIDGLLGEFPISGSLPFDLPRDDASVIASREDVPFDLAEPLFRSATSFSRCSG